MSIEKISILKGHTERVWCVAWNLAGTHLASCSGDKKVRIWCKENEIWQTQTILADAHSRAIRSIVWSPCGNFLASTSFDATTAIWDKRGGEFECTATLEGHENEVKSASWSCSGQYLATCSRDKSVWIWEVGEDGDYECASVINSHTQDVKRVLWHPVKDILASSSYDNTIKFYKDDLDDWSCFCTLTSHESTVWGIAFNNDGSLLASCSDDKTVKIWKEYMPGNSEGVPTPTQDSVWKCVCTLSGYHERPIYDISWCHLTGLIATAAGDDCIRIFREDPSSDSNAPTFSLLASQDNAHDQDVNSVDWNPKITGLLASCSDDHNVTLWQVKEHNELL